MNLSSVGALMGSRVDAEVALNVAWGSGHDKVNIKSCMVIWFEQTYPGNGGDFDEDSVVMIAERHSYDSVDRVNDVTQ